MRFLRPTAFFAAALIISAGAQAAPVATWAWEVSTEFDTASTVFTAGPGATTNTALELAWGVPLNVNQSSLVISGNPAGDPPFAVTDGGPTLTQIFTHNNFVQQIGSTQLDHVNVLSHIELTPSGGGTTFMGDAVFDVNFQETPNDGPCAAGTGAPPCPDIFVLGGGVGAFNFIYDGYLYSVSIIETTGALNPLPPAACTAAGALSPCLGFLTPENQATQAQFAFLISAREITVPEPGTLALLGLALFGIAWTTRRRRS